MILYIYTIVIESTRMHNIITYMSTYSSPLFYGMKILNKFKLQGDLTTMVTPILSFNNVVIQIPIFEIFIYIIYILK